MKNISFFRQKRATSILEYTILLVIVLAAFLVTQKYIVRGFAGRWKQVGDSFGYGLQYDPKKTAECVWHANPANAALGNWYSPSCFEQYYDSNYNAKYNSCITHCSTMGQGANQCNNTPPVVCCSTVWTITICDPACCYFNCKQRCTDTATTTTVNQCSSVTVNGTTRSCNAW